MKEQATFSVHVRRVDGAGSDLEFPVDPSWLETELAEYEVVAPCPGSLKVKVTPISPGFWVEGSVDITIVVTCLRCLRPANLDLRIPFKVHMTPGPPSDTHVEESYAQDGSLGVGHFQGEEIVLDNLVRESIVLALPMSPRCPSGCSVEDLYRDDD